MTIRVWNGDQGSRSMRAGIKLRMLPGACAAGAVVMVPPAWKGTCLYPGHRRLTRATTWFTRPGDHAEDGRRFWTTGSGHDRRMQLPKPRGPLSAGLCTDLSAGRSLTAGTAEAAQALVAAATDPLTDEDLQLSLAICYE